MRLRRRVGFSGEAAPTVSAWNYSRDLRRAKWGSGFKLHGSIPKPLMAVLRSNENPPFLAYVRASAGGGHNAVNAYGRLCHSGHSGRCECERKTALRRSLKGRPRRSLRCLGFLNSLCGIADHVHHSLWLGEHRDVTGAQLDVDRQATPSTFWLNRSGTGAAWVAHTSFCSASGKSPAKLPIPPGCFSQMRPSATSMWEKTSVTGNFCCKLCEVSVSSGARAAM